MNKEHSIRINLFYNIAYQALVVVISLITTPYVSRVLGPTAIGAYSYTLSVATYFGIFGALGASTYGQLQVAKNRYNVEKLTKTFYTVMYSKIITFLISFFGYFIMLRFSRQYMELFIILLIYLVAQMIDISWFYQGLEAFCTTVSVNIATKILSLFLIFVLVNESEDLFIYVVIQQGALLTSNLSMWFSLHKYIGLPKLYIRDAFVNIKQNIAYFIPTIATVIYVSVDKCMIGWITRSNLENGYYEQASKIYSMLVVLITALTTVLLPRMSFLWEDEKKNQKEITSIFGKALRCISGIVFPIALGLFVTADNLSLVFFGTGFEKCGILLRIFSVVIVFTSFNSIISNSCMVARGKQGEFNKLLVLSSLVNIAANFILIYCFESVGAALASLFSEFILLICTVLKNRKFLLEVHWIKNGLKYFIFSLFMACILVLGKSFISFDNSMLLLVEILAGGLIYSMCLFISRDELLNEVIDKIFGLIERK